MMSLQILQERLGYSFKDSALLQTALTHRSHSSQHNERLEFLGDSILNCVIATLLYERFAQLDEGSLSRFRSNLVRQKALYEIAQELEMHRFLRLGEGELKAGGFRRPSILADTLEAVFGAIFLDSDFATIHQIIRKLFQSLLDEIDQASFGKDAKTQLQEYLQGRKIALPEYHVVATHGAAHNQEFEVDCVIPKLDIHVFGTGHSRRAGEQDAAQKALEEIMRKASGKKRVASKKSKKTESQMKLIGVATTQIETFDEVESSHSAK